MTVGDIPLALIQYHPASVGIFKVIRSDDKRGCSCGHVCGFGGRAFVLFPDNRVITEEQRTLIERLWLERISLRGICRVDRR